MPERQKELLRLIGDGLSDSDIAGQLGEPEDAVALEIRGVLTELGFRTRTHAIVYVLARQISARSEDRHRGAPPASGPRDDEAADEDRPA